MPGTAYYAYSPLKHFEPFADRDAAEARKVELQQEHPPHIPFFVQRFYTFEKDERVVCRRGGWLHRIQGEAGTIVGIATDNGHYRVRWDFDGKIEETPPSHLEPERP